MCRTPWPLNYILWPSHRRLSCQLQELWKMTVVVCIIMLDISICQASDIGQRGCSTDVYTGFSYYTYSVDCTAHRSSYSVNQAWLVICSPTTQSLKSSECQWRAAILVKQWIFFIVFKLPEGPVTCQSLWLHICMFYLQVKFAVYKYLPHWKHFFLTSFANLAKYVQYALCAQELYRWYINIDVSLLTVVSPVSLSVTDGESPLASVPCVETVHGRDVTQQLKQANDTIARLQDELSDFRQRSAPLWEKEMKDRKGKISVHIHRVSENRTRLGLCLITLPTSSSAIAERPRCSVGLFTNRICI